jgi:GT2 family glycosyltransferase
MGIGATPPQRPRKDVSIVIGSYNRRDFLKLTLNTVRQELEGLPHEIVVVDGGSTDGSVGWLASQRDVISVIQHNRGTWRSRPIERRSWGYFMNLGFKLAQGRYVCMLSDDCLVVPGAIRNGIAYADQVTRTGRKIGAVAFFWRNWPEQLDYWVGLTLGGKMFVNHGLFLREALAAVGYVDEETYAFYHADGDLCLRLWESGFECIESPDSFIEHYSHAGTAVRASNMATQREDWEQYIDRWSKRWGVPDATKGQGWIYRSFIDSKATAQKFHSVTEVRKRMAASKLRDVARRARRLVLG